MPQHDRFDPQKGSTRLIDRRVEEIVQSYAKKMGWYSPGTTPTEADSSSENVLQQVAAKFYQAPDAGQQGEDALCLVIRTEGRVPEREHHQGRLGSERAQPPYDCGAHSWGGS